MADGFAAHALSATDLTTAARLAVSAADRVSGVLRENFGASEFATKQDEGDWVTRWDIWAEEVIKDTLSGFAGGVGFRGEETDPGERTEVYWTIDPIDGTGHFVRGSDFCTTMIALVDHGTPVVAVIHDFVRGDLYTATCGGGAYRNGTERLRVSGRPLANAFVELTMDECGARAERARRLIVGSGARLLRTEASGFALASVARGATEGVVVLDDPYCQEWDLAPGCLLVHEAGGTVRNIGADGFRSTDTNVIAASPAVFEQVDALISRSQGY